MAKNETYKRLIHTMRWLRLRREVLSAHPVCEACEREGRLSAATEVHHIIPCETATTGAAMETLMFDPHNLAALCHNCHRLAHTALGKGGKQERRNRADGKLRDFARKFFPEDPGGVFLKRGEGH